MAKESGTTHRDIMNAVNEGKYAPVYMLMGDEDYYIDLVSQHIADKALKPEERDFNLGIMYGAESKAVDIVNVARQFPMLAERRVVLVREFQSVRDKELLAAYAKNPMPSTILILCHKHGAMEGGKALLAEIRKSGVVMSSQRLPDYKLPAFVADYIRSRNLTIEQRATQMLCDHVGSDLTRLVSEIEKLLLVLPAGETRVLASLVEEQTGVSKDYNTYELQNAFGNRDALKANRIVNYYATSPRGFNLAFTLSSLFGFFVDVLQAYYAPDQSDDGIARWVGRTTWAARQAVIPARRTYKANKVLEILSQIRETDAKSKGVGGCRTPFGELLRELTFFILH